MTTKPSSYRPPWASEAVRLYHDEKKSLREIGEKFGVSYERVRQVLALMGRPAQRSGRPHPRAKTGEMRTCQAPGCTKTFYVTPSHYDQKCCSKACGAFVRYSNGVSSEADALALRLVANGYGLRRAVNESGMPIGSGGVQAAVVRLHYMVKRRGVERPGLLTVNCRRCRCDFQTTRPPAGQLGPMNWICPDCAGGKEATP